MKNRILLPILLVLAACAGSLARTNVSLPAMRSSWMQLRPAVERQLALDPSDATEAAMRGADAAMQSGDAMSIGAVAWPLIEAAAMADLDRMLATGQLGPLGAESRRGLVADFAEQRALYLRITR